MMISTSDNIPFLADLAPADGFDVIVCFGFFPMRLIPALPLDSLHMRLAPAAI